MAQTQHDLRYEYGLDVTRTFPPVAVSVPEARRWVRSATETAGLGHRRRVLELLTTELVSNVVVHVGSPFTVRFRFDGRVIRVEVEDRSTDVPREGSATPEATTGRGYGLVRRLSRRSGVDVHASGKVVWFEIDAFRQLANRNGSN